MLTGTYLDPDVGVHHLWYQQVTHFGMWLFIEDSSLPLVLVALGTSTPLARRTSDRARSETRVLDPPEKEKELQVIISRGMGTTLLRRGYPP